MLPRWWQGPAGLPRSLRIEWRLAIVRWLAILCVGPALLLLPLSDEQVLIAYGLIAVAAVSNARVQWLIARRAAQLNDATAILFAAYADLAIAHQELLSVDEMKTNLLSNASHELRAPLTSIRSFSELLLSYEENDPHVQREFAEIINSESERLTRLLNDVLGMMKIELGQMGWDIETMDMAPQLREAARIYARMAAQQGLAFSLDVPETLPPIEGDRDRLQQVIDNLLGNALKFTASGSISLSARQVDSELHVSVSDTGIGIAREDQERIFEKFQQVGAVLTDKPFGTGLGLSICREIVDHHRGRIWVESVHGVGTTFTFALALSEPARAGSGTRKVGGGRRRHASEAAARK